MATQDLSVYFLNVGQGLCFFIKLPNGDGIRLFDSTLRNVQQNKSAPIYSDTGGNLTTQNNREVPYV